MLLLLLLCGCGLPWPSGTLELINNGYEDFVVAINENVQEDSGYFNQIEVGYRLIVRKQSQRSADRMFEFKLRPDQNVKHLRPVFNLFPP